MRSLPARLVAVLLLLVQAWIGVGRGHVICVPMQGDCCRFETTACDCCCDEAGEPEPGGAAEPAGHDPAGDDGPCGCCLHLPTPSPDQIPQPRGEVDSGARIVLAMLPATFSDRLPVARVEPSRWHPPPDPTALAQARGLKHTRLNI